MLVNAPVPVPLLVIPLFISSVGVCLKLHTTPRAVMVAPPSEVILPPETPVFVVISVPATVVNVGVSSFLQLLSIISVAQIRASALYQNLLFNVIINSF